MTPANAQQPLFVSRKRNVAPRRARRAGADPTPRDPWRDLAAAVVETAIRDSRGLNLLDYSEAGRAKVIAEAQCWLLGDAGAALLAELDLDHEVVLDALTRPTRPAATSATTGRRRRRARQ